MAYQATMKRTCTFLLIAILLISLKQGYESYMSAMYVTERFTGALSDVADEVIAIPLEPAAGKAITKARFIRETRGNLFLVSDSVLYRYSRSGEFICRVSDPERVQVAGYVVDEVKRELIVLGNTNDIYYYSFDGKLKGHMRFAQEQEGRRILSLAMHNNHVLTLEESLYFDPDTQSTYIRKELVAYDTSFRKLDSRNLLIADLGRSRAIESSLQPRICVDPDTGSIYVHCPSVEPDYLLQDTTYIRLNWNRLIAKAHEQRGIPLVPVCKAGRFWFSSLRNEAAEALNYHFCLDSHLRQYVLREKGWEDSFFGTGEVTAMEPMDVYNMAYSFLLTGQAAKKAFPHVNSKNAVLCLLKMKA